MLKKGEADLKTYARDRADEEQAGDEMVNPAKVLFGRARGDRGSPARDLGEMCHLRGRQLAEAEVRLLVAAVEFAWAGQDGISERALGKAKETAAMSPAALMCQFGPSTTDQGSGCGSLDRAPAKVRTLMNEWRSSGATDGGVASLEGAPAGGGFLVANVAINVWESLSSSHSQGRCRPLAGSPPVPRVGSSPRPSSRPA